MAARLSPHVPHMFRPFSTAALITALAATCLGACGDVDTSVGGQDPGPDASAGVGGQAGSGGTAGVDAGGTGGTQDGGDGSAGAAGDAGLNVVKEIVSGLAFSCARFDQGQVRCWGNNVYGQQGHTTPDRGLAPGEMGAALPAANLGTGRTAKVLATGAHHACAVLDDDSVKCWGHNRHGALGLGDAKHRSDAELGDALPAVSLGTGRTAKQVVAGFDFSCALLDDNSVKCWGLNSFGQLGQGHNKALGDEPGEMGDALPKVDLGTGRSAKFLAAGRVHACAILDNDSVKCWGFNAHSGVLGIGAGGNRGDGPGEMGDALPAVELGTGRTATTLSGGGFHTCAILDDKSVKCWGLNASGQLGQGDKLARGDGPGEMGDTLPAVALGTGRTATRIVAGVNHSCAVLDDASVKCWGDNAQGQLGQGNTTNLGDETGEMGDALLPVALGTGRTALALGAGASFSCAVLDDNKPKCWGANSTGALGVGDNEHHGDEPNEMGNALPSVDLGASAASLGQGTANLFACALLSSGQVKCWGSNYFGELGAGPSTNIADKPGELAATPAVSFGTGRSAVAVAAGSYTLCALLDDGSVKCLGDGSALLGQGDRRARGARPADQGDNLPKIDLGTGRTAKALATGNHHACAILDDDSLKCWGENKTGQLGLGDTDPRGDDPGEMGDSLPRVDLGTGRKPVAVFAGGRSSCAILDNASLKCWGENNWGRLGLGDTDHRGDDPGEMGDALPAIDLGSSRTAQTVALGTNSICAVLDDSALKCWGGAGQGLLGSGATKSLGDQPGEMGDALPSVNLGAGVTATGVSVGDHHVCTLLSGGAVKCFGDNAFGQLGLGDTADRGDGPGEMGAALPELAMDGAIATRVSVGFYHSCALIDGGSVKCWGDNDMGQLGIGDNLPRGAAPGQLGSNLFVTGL